MYIQKNFALLNQISCIFSGLCYAKTKLYRKTTLLILAVIYVVDMLHVCTEKLCCAKLFMLLILAVIYVVYFLQLLCYEIIVFNLLVMSKTCCMHIVLLLVLRTEFEFCSLYKEAASSGLVLINAATYLIGWAQMKWWQKGEYLQWTL